jgi:hypothetical protein
MIPSDFIVTHAPMHLRLEIRKKCNFFWLRDIRDVDISQCCAKCFIGEKDNRVYYGTLQKSSAVVDIIVKQSPRAKAYYLCGLSEGFVWELNTHVAFVPDSNSEIHIDNDRIKLDITNARRIHFWDYVPNPPGIYTKQQRTCRNWIFANYLKDGMPL